MAISVRIISILSIGVSVVVLGTLSMNIGVIQAQQAPAQPPVLEMTNVGGAPILDPPRTVPTAPEASLSAPELLQPGDALAEHLAQVSDPAAGTLTDQQFSAFGLPCGLTVSAEAQPAAMVALDIISPCQPETRIVIEHSGLTLTATNDALGILTLNVPVFETPAFFTIRMPDGSRETALVAVPDLSQYERVGVQWNGERGLELHALEFGANYGESGHIWQETPGMVDHAIAGDGGFVTVLGLEGLEDAMAAQIYTFPRDTVLQDGVVRLTIEAPITNANCGQQTMARTLQTEQDGAVAVIELTFTLPECDAVGDFLVLQNLLRDLRVAAN
jgi:hypothetical protein